MSIELRPAELADWPLIWPIFAEVVRAADTYAYEPTMTPEQAAATWLERPPATTWLALDDSQVLGTYKSGPNRPGPGAHVATASYMVAASARGRGIGRAMVEHSLALARARGFRGMQFNAVAETNVYAIKLYQDLGFEIVGRVPQAFAHPERGYVDLVIMYADLTRPGAER